MVVTLPAIRKARTDSSSTESSLLKSETVFELVWWHLALIIPTIAFKYLYVRRMSFTTGLQTILESLGSGIERYFNFLLLVTVDFLEVSLIVGVLFVVGRLLLHLPYKGLIFASVLLLLVIMSVNQFSLLLVANLVTLDTLAISATWAKEDPRVIWQSLTASQIGFLLLAVTWASLFAILPSRLPPSHRLLRRFKTRWFAVFSKTILLASAFGCLALLRIRSDFPPVLRGYWSSTFVSFFKLDTPELPFSEIPAAAEIRADYERLVYPRGMSPQPLWLTSIPNDRLSPRHIVIVGLETAPRQFYPLLDDPALPVFYEMSKRALVSNNHYAMSPYTWWNNASIVSGTYFIQKGKGIFDYGDFRSDSIASILAKRGYTTTFVDSFKVGWAGPTDFYKNLNFNRLVDTTTDPVPFDRSSFAVIADKERQSFSKTFEAIVDAEGRNQKALVMIATTIGHHPLVSKPGAEGQSAAEKMFRITALFDELLGKLLSSLSEHGLREQVLIVVTGDHGFRMRREFESVGLPAEQGTAAFNVPFMLYGPGLFERQIRLPYVTSHVDIGPTLLALTGIEEDSSWLHHGTHMLDQRLRDRVTFMMNTNLSPVSGFHWNGCHYTLNDFTGKVRVTGRSASDRDETSAVLPDDAVRSMMDAAHRQFQHTLAHFQRRKGSGAT